MLHIPVWVGWMTPENQLEDILTDLNWSLSKKNDIGYVKV
jgi:hypothetical protein